MSLGNLLYVLEDSFATSTCQTLKPFLDIVGYVVIIVKIVIPILLIVFGMLDVGKSVIASKPDEVNKNLKSFAMRCVAAVLIFFIPSIVSVLINAVAQTGGSDATGSNADANKNWLACWQYVLNPNSSN